MSKITFKLNPLKQALNSCSTLMSNKIMQNFSGALLLEISKDKITFKATDGKLYLSYDMKKEDYTYKGEDFSVIIIGRKIYEVISKIDSGNVVIDFKKDNVATLTSNSIKITISTADHSMFPAFPKITNPSSFVIPSEVLYYMYKKTSYAASKVEAASILTGLYHTIKDNVFRIIGCDRQRIAVQAFNVSNIEEEVSLTVPLNMIDEIKKNMEEGPVTVSFDDSYISYSSGNTLIYSKILDGNYPDVLRLIPPTFSSQLKINTKVFKDAITRSSLFHDNDSHLTFFVIQPDTKKMTIFSNKNAFGQLKEDISIIQSMGEKIIFSFNTKYIQDTINNINSDYIYFKYNNETTPVAITSESDLQENIDIILPCRSQYLPTYDEANAQELDSEEEQYEEKNEELNNPFNQEKEEQEDLTI